MRSLLPLGRRPRGKKSYGESTSIPKCKQKSSYTECSPRLRQQLEQRMRPERLFSMR
jgi:hypothetical protein